MQPFPHDLELTPTRGPASHTLPLGPGIFDDLSGRLAAHPTHGPRFTDEVGEQYTYRRWKRIWAAACSPSKFRASARGLRHFTASALISGGASVKQVQAVLGHASATITLRTYAHRFPGVEDRTRKLMDAASVPLRTEAASI